MLLNGVNDSRENAEEVARRLDVESGGIQRRRTLGPRRASCHFAGVRCVLYEMLTANGRSRGRERPGHSRKQSAPVVKICTPKVSTFVD